MRWLIVRLAGVEFALPMTPVREMMQLRGQTLVPGPNCGLFRHRVRVGGAWLPLAAPHERLGLKSRPIGARTCLVLAEHARPRDAALRYGIIVDSVSRVEQFADTDLQRVNPDSGERFPYAVGRLRWNGKWHLALDLDALFPRKDLEAATRAPSAA